MSITRLESTHRGSRIVIFNNVVYLSGQVGDPKTDIHTQARDALTAVDDALAKAGTHKGNILETVVWLEDMADYDAMNEVWDAWVAPGAAPCRSTAGLKIAGTGYKVEFLVTAAIL